MTTAGNDTGNTREDELLARVYQQAIGAQAVQYAAAYDASAALARFTTWLQDHAAAELELDADQAVAELYSLHYRPLTRLATLLVRDAATAEDVVQDAFVAMRVAWPRLGDTEKALAYLRQAVVNRSRSVLRHRTVTGKNLPQALPDRPGAEHGALDLLDQPAAMAALLGLPERQREAIVLRFYADLSEDQIAAAMHISRGAVRSHTARGLSGLRAALGQASGPMTNDTIRGSSDRSILILTSLADGPKHGYALIKDIEGFAAVKLGPGTLYRALAKLEQAALVEALPPQDRRHPYRITATGREFLSERLTESARIAELGLRRIAAASK
jgi:RNA polymerase sigma-70 factor (sigma-E family)